MSCADIQNSLVEYLLNELDDAKLADVEQHLASDCIDCQTELHRLSDSMYLLWQSVPSPPLPPLLREQVLATCLTSPSSACEQKAVATQAKSTNKSSAKFAGEMLLAFAAGVLLMATMYTATKQSSDKPAYTPAAFSQRQARDASRFGTDNTPEALEMSGRPYKKSHFVALHRQTKANELSGQLLWDRLNREIHIYCFGLSAPSEGKQYTLWMVGPQKTIRIVDELKVDAAGECRAVAHWPVGEFQYVQVALSPTATLDTLSPSEVTLTSDALPPTD